jgi:hypothetical protein
MLAEGGAVLLPLLSCRRSAGNGGIVYRRREARKKKKRRKKGVQAKIFEVRREQWSEYASGAGHALAAGTARTDRGQRTV